MRRAYRAGAAVAATATLLTGAGFATLHEPARPAPTAAVPEPAPTGVPDELAALRADAAALTAEIAARKRDASVTTAPQSGRAPATDATTGAGDHEERGDDD